MNFGWHVTVVNTKIKFKDESRGGRYVPVIDLLCLFLCLFVVEVLIGQLSRFMYGV